MEEYIGKCNLVTPIVIFIAFLEQAHEQNNFGMSTVQKILIFNKKINI